jgi:hypothetical protein
MALIMTVYNMKRVINIIGIEKLKTWEPNYPKATMPIQKRAILSLLDEPYFSNIALAA